MMTYDQYLYQMKLEKRYVTDQLDGIYIVAELRPNIDEIYPIFCDFFDKGEEKIICSIFCERIIKRLGRNVIYRLDSAFFDSINMEKEYWEIASYIKYTIGGFVIADLRGGDKGKSIINIKKILDYKSPFKAIILPPYFKYKDFKIIMDLAKKNNKAIFLPLKKHSFFSPEGKLSTPRMIRKCGKYTRKYFPPLNRRSEYNLIGAIVNIGYKERYVKRLRKRLPNTVFLVEGYETERTKNNNILRYFSNGNFGKGIIVETYCTIMDAYKSNMWKKEYLPEEFVEAVQAEYERIKSEISSQF